MGRFVDGSSWQNLSQSLHVLCSFWSPCMCDTLDHGSFAHPWGYSSSRSGNFHSWTKKRSWQILTVRSAHEISRVSFALLCSWLALTSCPDQAGTGGQLRRHYCRWGLFEHWPRQPKQRRRQRRHGDEVFVRRRPPMDCPSWRFRQWRCLRLGGGKGGVVRGPCAGAFAGEALAWTEFQEGKLQVV